ncbi:MAG: hypothetical protein IPM23_00780 [Candidatus Melainabacteria bacterium]|nr:hypothetical protein [Candidatus Melainabacteria bacterium]
MVDTVIFLLVFALLWCGFLASKRNDKASAVERLACMGAMAFTALLAAYYYEPYYGLWCGFSAACGWLLGKLWRKYESERG